MSAVMIDEETGEMIASTLMVRVETAPAISLDLSLVATHHKEPQKLVDLINNQAGFVVFGSMQDKKQRKACASHSASIIRCISPAADESKRMAAEAKKVVNQDLSFRRDFDAGVREVAAFHRQPLTDWETEQARLEAEQLAIEEARLAAEKLEIDHQDALDMDELRTLRKQREAAVEQARLSAKAIEDKHLFDEAVAKQLYAQRLQIEAEATRKAEAEQAAKLESEREKIRAEEQAKLANVIEKTRLATLEYTKELAEDKAKQAESSFKDDSRELEPTLIKPIRSNPKTRNRIIGAVAFDFDCSLDDALQIILNEFGIEIPEYF
jgi:hypothetical protein